MDYKHGYDAILRISSTLADVLVMFDTPLDIPSRDFNKNAKKIEAIMLPRLKALAKMAKGLKSYSANPSPAVRRRILYDTYTDTSTYLGLEIREQVAEFVKAFELMAQQAHRLRYDAEQRGIDELTIEVAEVWGGIRATAALGLRQVHEDLLTVASYVQHYPRYLAELNASKIKGLSESHAAF